MIARITSGNFIKGAVAYNEEKVAEGEASAIDMRNFDDEVADSAEAVAKMMMQCTKATSNNNSRVVIKKPNDFQIRFITSQITCQRHAGFARPDDQCTAWTGCRSRK